MAQSISNRVAPSAAVAGALYIAASLGFLVVFSWLAARFGYPDVLDQPANDVLPRLLALGGVGRGVWAVYAVLPLLLIPAALGASAALRGVDARNTRALNVGMSLQIAAAFAMTIGLARWSTAQWGLAEAWPASDAVQQVGLVRTFDALNLYLGNVVGEFIGELLLYSSFAAFGLALHRVGSRWMARLAASTAFFGMIGMFRNITSIVQPASDVTNVLLPLFLIAFGVTLIRRHRATSIFAPRPAAVTT